MSDLKYGINAVTMSDDKFLTVSSLTLARRIGNFNVFDMKLVTYTVGARNPVKILRDVGVFRLKA